MSLSAVTTEDGKVSCKTEEGSVININIAQQSSWDYLNDGVNILRKIWNEAPPTTLMSPTSNEKAAALPVILGVRQPMEVNTGKSQIMSIPTLGTFWMMASNASVLFVLLAHNQLSLIFWFKYTVWLANYCSPVLCTQRHSVHVLGKRGLPGGILGMCLAAQRAPHQLSCSPRHKGSILLLPGKDVPLSAHTAHRWVMVCTALVSLQKISYFLY